ncbi:MAG: hypothetical protein SGCHY_004131 [Lobulomycetales sp.]
MFSTTFAFLIIALAKASASDAPFLSFEHADLEMTSDKGVISLGLQQQPIHDVIVTFSQEMFLFDSCQLVFTPQNYNDSQTIEILAAPGFTKKMEEVEIEFSACLGNATETAKQLYKVKPKQFDTKTCSSVGDPHIKPFNEAKFNWQEEGCKDLFRSDQLVIEALHSKLNRPNGKVSWNEKIGIRYGSTAFVFTQNSTSRTVIPKQISPTKNNDELVFVSTDNGEGKEWEITLGDGSVISIDSNGKRIDVSMILSPERYPGATGLCFGNKNDCPAYDNMFEEQCNIPEVEFQKPCKQCLPPAEGADLCAPYVPPVVDPRPGCVLVTDFEEYKKDENQVYVPDNTTYAVVTEEEARERCEALILPVDTGNTLGLDYSDVMENAVMDYVLTGDIESVEQYRRTYLSSCSTAITLAYKSASAPEEIEYLEKVATKAGLAGKCVPSQCGAHGKCSIGGCSCDTGYAGPSCQYEMRVPEAIKATSGGKTFLASTIAIVGAMAMAL